MNKPIRRLPKQGEATAEQQATAAKLMSALIYLDVTCSPIFCGRCSDHRILKERKRVQFGMDLLVSSTSVLTFDLDSRLLGIKAAPE